MTTEKQLRQKEACDEVLMALLGSEQMVANWWFSPNAFFSFHTPMAIWKNDPQRVADYITSQIVNEYS